MAFIDIEQVLKDSKVQSAKQFLTLSEVYNYETNIYTGYITSCLFRNYGIYEYNYASSGYEKIISSIQYGQVSIDIKESYYKAGAVDLGDPNSLIPQPIIKLNLLNTIHINTTETLNSGYYTVYGKRLEYSGYTLTRSYMIFPICEDIRLSRFTISASLKIDFFTKSAKFIITDMVGLT